MVNDKIKTKKLNEIVKKLESMKKKQYSSRELRNKNQMMNRLDRIQDRDLNRRISLTQDKIKKDKIKKDKSFLDSFSFNEDDQGEDEDILKMFGIKKKHKVQKHRGGFWNR